MWTGGDVSARYERARIAAQQKVDHNLVKISINLDAAESGIEEPRPYESALQDDESALQDAKNPKSQRVLSLARTAERQATESRQQVLGDITDGGPQVLKDEAREEKDASWAMLKRRTPASVTQADSFKGLRDRITGSLHGRTRGVLGMESSS